jgi:putative nucleotidyltransferase with HDIG domain
LSWLEKCLISKNQEHRMPPRFIIELQELLQSSLPTDSNIVGNVVRIIYNQKSSANDLAEVILRDPPLTAKILKAANSAFYGSAISIRTLRRAVVTLGFETIKELVTAVTMSQFFFGSKQSGELDRLGLWVHSIGTAKAAQLICTRMGIGRPDVVYTVGLLHDIGKIVLALLFPEHYQKVINLAKETNCRISLAEQKILNTNHCMVGKVLCEIWSLPEDISNAVFFHNNPLDRSGQDSSLVNIIYLADIIARTARIGNPGDNVVPEPSRNSLKILGPTHDKISENFNTIVKDLLELKPEIDGFFSNLHKY